MIDTNRDLYITPVVKQNFFKLATMTDTLYWNDVSDTLAAVADNNLVSWYYPGIAYVDRDLLVRSKVSRSAEVFGKLPQIVNFFGSRISIRRVDGALISDM